MGRIVSDNLGAPSVCVIGLGKLGLPLALNFASNGVRTNGFDIDSKRVSDLNSGTCDFIEPGLTDQLSRLTASRDFTAFDSLSQATSDVSHVVVVVPLDIDSTGIPDFTKIDFAISELASCLKPGQTVIVETTVPVGTTRSRVARVLEERTGLIAGKEFFVAFSPERVSSGSMKKGFAEYPKLVGGLTDNCALKAKSLYSNGFSFTQNPSLDREVGVWIMQSAEAAEFAKLAETTYRDVNLALANTFALACLEQKIDYFEVIEACNSQPFSHLHKPGISVGGHCIPVYPHLYLSTNDGMGLVEVAREVNERVPAKMVAWAAKQGSVESSTTALIIGLGYRSGVKESAHSGAYNLQEALEARGVNVELADELFTAQEVASHGFTPKSAGSNYSSIFINSGSPQYVVDILDQCGGDALIIDGRRTLDANPPLNYIRL
jgi:UDP-N-acetyl-D-glucosamine dehydrogenase